MRIRLKTIVTILSALFICAGCRKEEANTDHAQSELSVSRDSEECVSPIEREMTNMPLRIVALQRSEQCCHLFPQLFKLFTLARRGRI